jgi:hypothetical protein
MVTAVATGHRPSPTGYHLTLPERRPGPNNHNTGKAGQTSSFSTHHPPTKIIFSDVQATKIVSRLVCGSRLSTHTRLGQIRDQIGARRGTNIGKVAAARELLTLVYYGLRDGHVRCLHRTSA